MMDIIKLKIPEFTKLMRESAKVNAVTPVSPTCWREMKRALVENKRLTCVQVTHYGIRFFEAGDFPYETWLINHHPGLSIFIEWIFTKQEMLSTTTSNGLTINTVSSGTTNFINESKTSINDTVISSGWNLNDSITFVNGNSLNINTTECTKKEKEKKSMFNFDFGKVTSDRVRFSMYGIAVKNMDGRYVAYDVKTHSVMDVEILNMPCGDMLYKMPVAIKDIKTGDVVIHNKVPMFVVEVHDSTLKVVDIHEGTEKEIYLTKNMFNFNFATKVVSMFDLMGNDMKPSADQPFGNPMMLMMLMNSDNMKDMLPFMMMNNCNNTTNMNPVLMYYMFKDKDKDQEIDPMMMFAMMNITNSMGTSK